MKIITFTFHGIGEPPPEVDDSERRVWLSRADFYSTLDAISRHENMHATVDDGNLSDVTVALPALLERGMVGRFFIVVGRIGMPGYVGIEDLLALRDAGMEIGLHGMRHRPWRRLSKQDLGEEIGEAKLKLESYVDTPITSAACPFGTYDRGVLNELRRSGFARIFTSDGGYASSNAWLQPRSTLPNGSNGGIVDQLAGDMRRPLARLHHAKTLIKRYR